MLGKLLRLNFVLPVLAALCVLGVAGVAFAAEGSTDNAFTTKGYIALGAALAIGIAALGGTLGQARAAAAALEGIARNPGAQNKVFVPMIVGLALIESLVLFAFLVAQSVLGLVDGL